MVVKIPPSTKILLSIASGILIALSFPTVLFGWHLPNFGFFAWFGLVPLIIAIQDAPPREAFKCGYLFGLVSFSISWYWLFTALNTFGHLPIATSLVVLALLILMMSLYPALACSLARTFVIKTQSPLLIWLPIFWVLTECARNYTPFSGFPWSPLSMSQTAYLPLIQFADITGAYGISFLIVWFNVWLARSRMEHMVPATICSLLLLALILGYGFYRLHQTEQEMAKAPHLKVALIQPNIPQEEKWDEATQQKQQVIFKRLVSQVENNADLIIWPEASFTNNLWLTDDKLSPEDIGLSTHTHARPYTLLGLNFVTLKNGLQRYFNSAALFDAQGNLFGKYHKKHLVPFGEYNPLQKWLPFIKPVAAVGDFEAGDAYHPIALENIDIAPLICYEDIFPEIARTMSKQNASLLVNITNDAWYGLSSAPFQHLALAALRSVETKRTMVRATNTGVTAVILPTGKVALQSPLFTEGVALYQAPLLILRTTYTRLNDWFIAACFIFVLWHLVKPYVERIKRKI